MNRQAFVAFALIIAVALAGCQQVPADNGRSQVDQAVEAAGRPAPDFDTTEPPDDEMSLAATVRTAFARSPALRATLARLGFGNAALYAASRIRNPVFSTSVLNPTAPGAQLNSMYGLEVAFIDFLTLPSRRKVAEEAFAATRAEVAAAVIALAADVEAAWYNAVSARQQAGVRTVTARAARLQAELAQRFSDAGNLTPRNLELARATAGEAEILKLEAELDAATARIELATLVGIEADGAWGLPDTLPLPSSDDPSLEELLAQARSHRLELEAARASVAASARRAKLVDWSRLLEDASAGIEHETEAGGSHQIGGTLALEIPLLNRRRDQQMRARAELEIAVADLRAAEVGVHNDVVMAHQALGNARQRMAVYRQRVVPARSNATARAQEEQNFMLIGAFELLETRQQEFDALADYVAAVGDYWRVRAQLTRAIGKNLPATDAGPLRLEHLPSPDAAPAPQPHHHHH